MNNHVPIQKHMNCIQMNLAYICSSLGRDFYNLFADSWDFYYKPKNDIFSPGDLSFKPFRKLSLESQQLRYLGMEAHELDPGKMLSPESIARCLEDYQVLLLNMDSFDCPWHRGYQKAHIDHYCLVTGLTEDGYRCADPYLLGNQMATLTCRQSGGCRELICYERSEPAVQLSMEGLFSEIISSHNSKTEMFVMMELFLRHFSELPDASRIYDYPQDVYLCAMTRATKFIADGRFQLGCLISKLGAGHPVREECATIVTLLNDSGDMWNRVNSLIIKTFWAPRLFEDTKCKIAGYLEKIIENEKDVCSRITDVCTAV